MNSPVILNPGSTFREKLHFLLPPSSLRGREIALIVGGARVNPAADLAELARPDLDWDYVYRTAQRHGLLSLLHGHLCHLAAVPVAVRERLQTHARANAARNLRLGGELLQLLQLFEAQDLPALPFKGPTLAALAYGSVALREFGDLDLLVPPARLPRAPPRFRF